MADAILNMVKSLLLSAFASFDELVLTASNVLTGGIDNSLWSSVVNMSNGLIPFCNIIIGICALIELAQVASKVDIIKFEHGLKIAVKLAISKVCIEVSPTFLHACYNQSSIFVSYFAGAGVSVSLGSTVSGYITPYIDSVSGLGNAIGLLASTLILQMGIKICGLVVVIMAYGRVFEILMYLLVSPIPCAFFPLGNGNGDGISRISSKFFKTFIAVCLQGLMMFMCIQLFGTIVNTAFANKIAQSVASGASASTMVSDLCYDMILFAIVLVMAVTKCGGWAKSIIDAG